MTDRLETLKKFLQEDPMDPFSRYALALEYASRKDFIRAVDLFDEVIKLHPEYIPAYQQLGILMNEQGKPQRARVVLEEGVRIALNAGDSHAVTEMRELLDELSARSR